MRPLSPRSIEPQNMPKGEQSFQRLAVVETSRVTKMQRVRTDAPPSMQDGAPSSVQLRHVSTSTLQSKGPAWLLPPVPSTHYLIDDLLDFKRPNKPSPLLQSLLSDTSEQALRPSDPSFLEAYTSAVGHALEHADPISSRDKNRTSWKYWTSFLTLMNSPPLRVPDPLNPTRDSFLKAAFLLWVRREAKSSIPGRSHIKAATALGHLYRVAKVHKNHDLEFTTTTVVRQIVKYLAREYALVHGPEALAPRRRESLSRQMLRNMLANLDNLRIRSREFSTIVKSSWLGRTLKAALCLSSAGGFRKAEVSLAPGEEFHALHMSRASLFFIIDGKVERCPTQSLLASMKIGDRIGVLAVPCKNDPLGLHFLPFPLIFNFNPRDDADVGSALRDLAFHCWVPVSELRSTPMFTYSSEKKALRRDFLDTILKALLLTVFPAPMADLYSWHSFRIGLACSLRAAGAPDWVILALCRWRSSNSIPVYARINYAASAQWIDDAGRQQVAAIQVPNLPGLSGIPTPRTALAEIPSTLPENAYALLHAAMSASDSLSTADMHALIENIPETDDDTFMADAQEFIVQAAHNDDA